MRWALRIFVGHAVGDKCIPPAFFIPVVMFAAAVFLSFSTGTSWGTFAILVPIATALFSGGGDIEMMVISVSAVLAGAVCGDHNISDLGYNGHVVGPERRANHINHVSTQMQYAAVVAAGMHCRISDRRPHPCVVDRAWDQHPSACRGADGHPHYDALRGAISA